MKPSEEVINTAGHASSTDYRHAEKLNGTWYHCTTGWMPSVASEEIGASQCLSNSMHHYIKGNLGTGSSWP